MITREFSVLRFPAAFPRKPRKTMHPNSILRQLGSLFIEEHVCAPPDARSKWMPVARTACVGYIGIYACPECGQRLARIGLATGVAPHPVLFKSANANGSSRAA